MSKRQKKSLTGRTPSEPQFQFPQQFNVLGTITGHFGPDEVHLTLSRQRVEEVKSAVEAVLKKIDFAGFELRLAAHLSGEGQPVELLIKGGTDVYRMKAAELYGVPAAQVTPEMRAKAKALVDGKPCGHPGCLNHRTHPCEGCGRIGGRFKP